jgi:Primase C terminal 1 (PriCT-1)
MTSDGHRVPEPVRRRIEIGERNNWLFSQCLRHAGSCDDLDTLLDVARTRAEEYFGEPMSDAEIVKTAKSAWGYEQRGENWAGTAARYPITMDELRRLEELGSDATVLAVHLRLGESSSRWTRERWNFASRYRAGVARSTAPRLTD